jgi:hypothetical protein
MINHCDRCITHLDEMDISFVLLNISSKFLLYLECNILSPKMHKKVNKYIKQTKRYISITKESDTSITVIYHAMFLTVLYMFIVYYQPSFFTFSQLFPYSSLFLIRPPFLQWKSGHIRGVVSLSRGTI